MKKLFIFLVCFVVFFTCTAFAEPYRVFDNADILTDEEEAQIDEMIRDFQMSVAMDFAVLTSNDAHDESQTAQIADSFYDEHDFGMGRNKSGALYYLDMANRCAYISTAGDMIDCMTDKRLSIAIDISTPALSNGEYAFGIMLMMTVVKAFVYDGPPPGQYRYEVK